MTLPKRHLNITFFFKRHLNILLSWVHNYMKTPKTIANTNQMQLGKIYPTLPKRHLNNYLALKRHLNILLCWVHNYMKTQKQ